jgi:hypothetical protein
MVVKQSAWFCLSSEVHVHLAPAIIIFYLVWLFGIICMYISSLWLINQLSSFFCFEVHVHVALAIICFFFDVGLYSGV